MRKRDPRDPSAGKPGRAESGREPTPAVDFAEGRPAIGPTEPEVEGANDRAGISANWKDATAVLVALLRESGVAPSRDAIGRITLVGAGLSNVVYATEVQLGAGQSRAVVVKLPSRYANAARDESLRAEAALLRYLCRQPLSFRVPRPIAELPTPAGLGVVQEWVDGLAVDLRAPRFPGGKPWELVAQVAAAIHAVDPAPVRELLPTHATWRDHALGAVSVLQELDEPEARDAEAWVREHLPAATPSCLLHGDLLGQNLRRGWDGDAVAVIDWGAARVGDPAYDLAIVTRGARRPFAVPDGMQRLLDAYNALAPEPLCPRQVRLHEVILTARFYQAAVRDYRKGSPHAENQRRVWRSVLGRATRKG